MARTTPDAVRGVLLRDYDDRALPDLTPFIAVAGVLTDRVRASAFRQGLTVTDAELEVVERLLAAHFYAVSDRPYASRGTQGATGTFDGKTGMALDASLYGQQAKVIDPTGFLATLGGGGAGGGGGRAVAGGFWAGTEDW
jgi:hypothetical protein